MPFKTVSQPGRGGVAGGWDGSRVGLLIRMPCVQDLHSFNPASGGLLRSFSGSRDYQTVTFSKIKNAS